MKIPDYTTLNRRVNRLNLSIDETLVRSDKLIYIALDSTGIKVHNSGDWIRRRFKVRRGYLKVHIAVNVKTRQIVSLALDVTRRYMIGRGLRSSWKNLRGGLMWREL